MVTNPPFSGDNMERALAFAAKCGKPWALLLPDFVARKAYFSSTFKIRPPSQRREGGDGGGDDGELSDGPQRAVQPVDKDGRQYAAPAPGSGLDGRLRRKLVKVSFYNYGVRSISPALSCQ